MRTQFSLYTGTVDTLMILEVSLIYLFLEAMGTRRCNVSVLGIIIISLLTHSTSDTSLGFPDSTDSKEISSRAGELDSIPGSGRSPGEGNGYPL